MMKVLALDKPQFAQSLLEAIDEGRWRRSDAQEADALNLRLLRQDSDWPGDHPATQQGDELHVWMAPVPQEVIR